MNYWLKLPPAIHACQAVRHNQWGNGCQCWWWSDYCTFIVEVFMQLTAPSSVSSSLSSLVTVMDMSRLYRSWSVAGHVHKAPTWWASTTWALFCSKIIQQWPWAAWQVIARLSDGRVRYRTIVDHSNWQPVFFPLDVEVTEWRLFQTRLVVWQEWVVKRWCCYAVTTTSLCESLLWVVHCYMGSSVLYWFIMRWSSTLLCCHHISVYTSITSILYYICMHVVVL